MFVVPDGDADGLSAGAAIVRALERMGRPPAGVLFTAKGESVHTTSMRARLARVAPEALVVLDTGSRAEPIADVPTLVVDHHQPKGFPPGALAVSAFGHEPVASSSWLAFSLVRALVDIDDLAWLPLLGTVGDLGTNAPFEGMRELLRRYGRTHVTRAVALLNAPRRTEAHDVALAWEVLLRATSPRDIAEGLVAGVDRLEACRAELKRELDRAGRAAPVFSGDIVLLPMRSGAKVHPLMARRWAERLPKHVVIAANYDYLPGRVNFSMRTKTGRDLIALLRTLHLPKDQEVGHGHPQATGGSLMHEDFTRMLMDLGFSLELVARRLERFAGA
jgi:single-stranded DNA-specific DHH superfamily exonuclease